MPYRENVCQISFVRARVTVLLAMSSMFMNQHCILNEVSLSRNIHKARICIDWLTKNVPRGSQNPALYFPRSSASIFTDSVFIATL